MSSKMYVTMLCTMLAFAACGTDDQVGSNTYETNKQDKCKKHPECMGRPNSTHCQLSTTHGACACRNERCVELGNYTYSEYVLHYQHDDCDDDNGGHGGGGSGGMGGQGGMGGKDGGGSTDAGVCDSGTVDSGGTGGTGGMGGGGQGGADGGFEGGLAGGTGHPPVYHPSESEGRVGWGCSVNEPGSGTTAFSDGNVLFFVMVTFFIIGFFLFKKNRTTLFILAFLLLPFSAKAETGNPKLRLNLDLVGQFTPADKAFSGDSNLRLGGEVGAQYAFTRILDAGAKLSIGENIGVRVVGTIHTDRSKRDFNPFFELRGIIHPAGGDAGFGLGGWAGVTYELGPGRIEIGPAVEFYTAPDVSKFRNWALLGIVGYQFDLFHDSKKAAAAPVAEQAPVPVQPSPVCQKPKDPPANVQSLPLSVKVLFDFDSDVMKKKAKDSIDNFMKQQPKGTEVVVMGFTCNIGTQQYNMELSKRRAKAVAKYIKAKYPSISVNAVGWAGESFPDKSNSTKAGRKANRRAEINILE